MVTLAEKPAPLATEAGHWYLPDGTPFYTTTGTNGKERPVTLADARKTKAVPSVTTITGIIKSDGLQRYFDRQMFDATVRMVAKDQERGIWISFKEWFKTIFSKPELTDVFFARCHEASRAHGKAAADKGTALHAAIETFLLGEYYFGEIYEPHVEKIIATLFQYGIDLGSGGEPEKSFAHPMGFGGKVDYHDRPRFVRHLGDKSTRLSHLATTGLVIDFKSKPKIDHGKRYAYGNHAMQLAAYRNGLGIPFARCINVFVGVEDKGVLIHEWAEADLQKAWAQFVHLTKFWQLEKDYFPGQ